MDMAMECSRLGGALIFGLRRRGDTWDLPAKLPKYPKISENTYTLPI